MLLRCSHILDDRIPARALASAHFPSSSGAQQHGEPAVCCGHAVHAMLAMPESADKLRQVSPDALWLTTTGIGLFSFESKCCILTFLQASALKAGYTVQA